jgi:CHASE2 domain-containing sensor protein
MSLRELYNSSSNRGEFIIELQKVIDDVSIQPKHIYKHLFKALNKKNISDELLVQHIDNIDKYNNSPESIALDIIKKFNKSKKLNNEKILTTMTNIAKTLSKKNNIDTNIILNNFSNFIL